MATMRASKRYWRSEEAMESLRRFLDTFDPEPKPEPAPEPEPARPVLHVVPTPAKKELLWLPDGRLAAACHPTRPVAARDLCVECYLDQRATKRGRVRPDLLTPRMIPGLRQNAFTEPPESCPKCRCPHLRKEDDRMLHCPGVLGGCGWTGFLVAS